MANVGDIRVKDGRRQVCIVSSILIGLVEADFIVNRWGPGAAPCYAPTGVRFPQQLPFEPFTVIDFPVYDVWAHLPEEEFKDVTDEQIAEHVVILMSLCRR